VSNVIGAGASLGILTSLMVAMLGQARYLCVIGRSGVMPAWLAKVHPKTATPVNASAFLGTSPTVLSLLETSWPHGRHDFLCEFYTVALSSPIRQRQCVYNTVAFRDHH
jgi:amino acid transporter